LYPIVTHNDRSYERRYLNDFSSSPIAENPSCSGTCKLNLFCNFQSGAYFLAVSSPSAAATQVMNFTIVLNSSSKNLFRASNN
jgi:hypothetical protein